MRPKTKQLLVRMLYMHCLQEPHYCCHQHTRQQRWFHQRRHQHSFHCEIHLPTRSCTKILALTSCRHTQYRRHSSAEIKCRNEGRQSTIGLIPRGTQRNRCHHSVKKHQGAQKPAEALVSRARPAQNMEG